MGRQCFSLQSLLVPLQLHWTSGRYQSPWRPGPVLHCLRQHLCARHLWQRPRLLRGGEEQGNADGDQLFHHQPGIGGHPPLRPGCPIYPPLHISGGVDFRTYLVSLGALRSRDIRVHFYAYTHFHCHRPLLCHHLPLQAPNEIDGLSSDHHGDLDICPTGHSSVRDFLGV